MSLALAACGSSSSLSAQDAQTCRQVAAVLSDGPDPGADPVGYAEAQVLPLRQIHTTRAPLQRAIDALAAAYAAYYRAHGVGASVRRAVRSASRALDAYCPGATT